MAISNKLVSKFVKATKNGTNNNKKEKIVYGTIARIQHMGGESEDIVYYAKIDGSTFDPGQPPDDFSGLIPITRFTAKVNVDDRVIITLKDHAAIITGSVTTPAENPVDFSNTIDEKIAGIETSSIAIADIQALWQDQ